MAYNTKELLALPDKEKRGLAKKLWKSLADNTSIAKEDGATVKELELPIFAVAEQQLIRLVQDFAEKA